MDDVDQKQQEEIVDLQKKDIAHEAQISLTMRLYIALFIVVLALFVGGVILTPFMMAKDNLNCPHPECVHHRGSHGG